MAASLGLLLSLLHLGTHSAQELASKQVPPHLTGCVSNDMETFRCTWSVGSFQNVSRPGDLRLFYVTTSAQECPQYGPQECFFSQNHTSIWTPYSVQLCSRDRAVVYDEVSFHVEEIVQPDPPVSLNWTLLSVSLSGTHFDVRLRWAAPQTADVRTGWMRLQYEVQHREAGGALWKAKELQGNTDTSLYGLQTDVEHEFRVRSKMLTSKEFGAFSDSILIHVPSKVSRFPVAILLIFAALCFIGILMLIMQQKLMVILLPPVPGPKIRGIDPELLKKGKLSELMSILGAHSDVKLNTAGHSDPWVEFIDLDMEAEPSEPSCGVASDGSPASILRTPLSFPSSPSSSPRPGRRDDSDSGRDSCCSDHHHPHPHDYASSCDPAPQQHRGDGLGHDTATAATATSASSWELVQGQRVGQDPAVQGPASGDLYTQVGHVHCSGEVLLTPGEAEVEQQQQQQLVEVAEEEKEKQKRGFQLVVVAEGGGVIGGYAAPPPPLSSPPPSSPPPPFGEYQESCPAAYTTTAAALPPPQTYTQVDGVDRQNGLLLTPSTAHAARPFAPKVVPTPEGYLTPDLLRDITP